MRLMLGLLYLIGGVSPGVCLARAITDDLGRVDVLARGIVVGMMTAASVTYLFALWTVHRDDAVLVYDDLTPAYFRGLQEAQEAAELHTSDSLRGFYRGLCWSSLLEWD